MGRVAYIILAVAFALSIHDVFIKGRLIFSPLFSKAQGLLYRVVLSLFPPRPALIFSVPAEKDSHEESEHDDFAEFDDGTDGKSFRYRTPLIL